MGAGGTLGSSRARQSRVQAGHHRQAAWLAWVDPPHLSYLPIHIGLAMAWQHGRRGMGYPTRQAGQQAAAGWRWGVGRWQGQVKRRGGGPGWWCTVVRRARRQGRGRATGYLSSEGSSMLGTGCCCPAPTPHPWVCTWAGQIVDPRTQTEGMRGPRTGDCPDPEHILYTSKRIIIFAFGLAGEPLFPA